ncbi:bifunctional diaminohydroxyphosphoribosylaminopyrimidine deaminase/5-amino-6-(5-phosphoribosylamino)uracil reductase RibD, partial [Candidatus Pelagibacter sp.]|nr:bifunctional diaminohydroxyphosphoribosylaminopyrimidine deaminase/5-amino-6-(5-phosphoribosylamino)uracil reductase RibD [Candidatus Pelagibacter sp.]
MSTKKDKFSKKDKDYMKLAINLAKARKGLTGENPSVGCLIVKNDKIVSIGQTGYNGRPHAEFNAIENSLQDLSGAKMYVTLEPCNHYGKTPPCTNSIIKSGIKEVFYSINDIDSKVKGKSFKILTKKNIKVRRSLLRNEAIDLYDSYIINRKYKLPFVTAKIAVSKNKLIYSEKVKRITDQTSEKLSHYLRYKNDAIMISSNTLNTDNPKLNCRLKGYENFSPKRIILDKN